MNKHVYLFGKNINEGNALQVDLLGGKGANLAEMSSLNIPVPPGFTITTSVCNSFLKKKLLTQTIKKNIMQSLKSVEKAMSKNFGDTKNPLLLSVRSGAKISMPGMMETVLNIGLTSKTIPALIKNTQNARFVYDSYRRLIMMYSDVVMEKAEQKNNIQIREKLENILDKYKLKHSIVNDHELTTKDLQYLIKKFKNEIKKHFKIEFPDSCKEQLWGAIEAVFKSWNGKRAIQYRNIENIPHNWGTAVNVQSMVFGNLGGTSATGVAFTRNPSNGNNNIYGEWLQNAQGVDVVAGFRSPNPINESSKTIKTKHSETLQTKWPNIYKKLVKIKNTLEKHYKDMQDVEFTIESGNLWMLQTRKGNRTGEAAIKIAVEMNNEKLITQKEVIERIVSKNIDEIMHPKVDPELEKIHSPIECGLPASPGGACGQIVFTALDAENWHKKNKRVLLNRHETSPEDVQGMHVSQGIITAKGGMTSHAALVARGWGKACIVGCSNLNIDLKHKTVTINGIKYSEGDWLTINSTEGFIYDKKLNLVKSNFFKNKYFLKLMSLTSKFKRLKIRTNADNPKDAALSKKLGAQGIGLCRTEHMFFNKQRIRSVQKMILSSSNIDIKNAIM